MTFEEFQALREGAEPSSNLPELLQALLYDARGDWDEAHRIAQGVPSPDGSWLHAYLHRKEGDLGNAAYWYTRSGRPTAQGSLESEWERIARFLLKE
jgi:hypothetical protein